MPGNEQSRTRTLTADQEDAAGDLLRLRRFDRPGYELPGLDTLLIASTADPAARRALGLDRGPLRRRSPAQLRRQGPLDLASRFSAGGPAVDAIREAIDDAARMWPTRHIEALTPIIEAIVAAVPDADAAAVMRWARAVLMAGAAAEPDGQFVISDREHLKQFAALNDHQLAGIERAAGRDGAPARIVAAALRAARDQLSAPVGIVAGTSHTYLPKSTLAVGSISVRAGEEDVADGSAQPGQSIFHQVRSGAHWIVDSAATGQPALVRGITRPLLTPIDLRGDADETARARLFRWAENFGLQELLAEGRTSATLQQGAAAAALAAATPGVSLPVVLPAIRIEGARAGTKFQSPLGCFEREMPGNSIADLDSLRRMLDGRCAVWLAETAVEEATGRPIAGPAWRVRLPSGNTLQGHIVLEHPDHDHWADVHVVAGAVRVRELVHPVAVRASDPRGDLVLLQVTGQPDLRSGTVPVIYFIASASLRDDPVTARAAGAMLLRLHGDEQAATTLRHARVAAVNRPARVLRGRGKQPGPWATRELERQLAGLARIVTLDPQMLAVSGHR